MAFEMRPKLAKTLPLFSHDADPPSPPPHFLPVRILLPSCSGVPTSVARFSSLPPAAALGRTAVEWLPSSTRSKRYTSLSVSLHTAQPSRDLDLPDSSSSLGVKANHGARHGFLDTRKILPRTQRFAPIEFGRCSARSGHFVPSVSGD